MSEKVLVDIDGVVLNLSEGIRLALEKKGIEFKPENVMTYNFNGNIGCNKKEVYKTFSDVDTFKNAPFYDDAVKAVGILRNFADVWSYTGTKEGETYKERQKLIAALGIKGEPYVFNKEFTCKPIIHGATAVFEDCAAILERWKDTDAELYLIDHTYNRDISEELENRVTRCDSFYDAVMMFIVNKGIRLHKKYNGLIEVME